MDSKHPKRLYDNKLLLSLKENYHAYTQTGLKIPKRAIKAAEEYVEDLEKLQ